MFESTRYGNYCYGSRKSDVEAILASGRHVLTVMDICSAMAMKTHFDNVITVYLKRDKRDLLADIVSRDIPVNDKVNRLLGVEAETQNAQICDIVARYEDTASATDTIFQALHLQ
jgi:guanylate kinase